MTDREQTTPDAIRQALRSLPSVPASADFTELVAARARREPATSAKRKLGARLAAAAVLLAGAGYLVAWQQSREADEARLRRAALLEEHRQLQRELEALRAEVADAPTLYLGTADDFDLVMDLEPWMDRPTAVQPAAYRP